MLEWERILKQNRLLRAMTGLNRKGFEALLLSFALAYGESLAESCVRMPWRFVKRYRAVSDVYRNRVTDFDDRLMLMAAGLWNFYLDAA